MSSPRRRKFITVKVKLPINAWSRALAEDLTDQLSNSVVPLIGLTSAKTPYLRGSGTLVEIGDYRWLATAKHVVEQPLFVGSSNDNRVLPLEGEFHSHLSKDIAVKRLSSSEEEFLSSHRFLLGDDFAPDDLMNSYYYASLIGYPHNRSKAVGAHISLSKERIFGPGRCSPNGEVHISFDKKAGLLRGDTWQTPYDPYGMSGGCICIMPMTGNHIPRDAHAFVAGIATDWKRKSGMLVGEPISDVQQYIIDITKSA